MSYLRHNWTIEEITAIYGRPITHLLYEAQTVHRRHFPAPALQLCSLCNIKEGGCPEDCAYCSQSAHYKTFVKPGGISDIDKVVAKAKEAKEQGASRFCMGAAWKSPPKGRAFDLVLEMIRRVRAAGIEVCCTLGLLNPDQARALKAAGLTAYNHNLDTSRRFYPKVVTTHSFDERLATIQAVQDAGIQICSGGILGMGETVADRLEMMQVLANLPRHPDSIPLNTLKPIPGTPMAERAQQPVTALELARLIATARVMMPATRIRLSAGRDCLSIEEHALCFMAGVNSIFTGTQLLTTQNQEVNFDSEMIQKLNLEVEACPSILPM